MTWCRLHAIRQTRLTGLIAFQTKGEKLHQISAGIGLVGPHVIGAQPVIMPASSIFAVPISAIILQPV
jgi:hypothetical protein